MGRSAGVLVLAAAATLLSACARREPPPSVHASMAKVIQPAADVVWGVSNNAFNSFGDGFDPARISEADWKRLAEASRTLRDRFALLADRAGNLVAAAPGETLEGEGSSGAATASQVQGRIKAAPQDFAAHARTLAEASDTLLKAAQARDVTPLYRVASGLDAQCDGCHEQFWDAD